MKIIPLVTLVVSGQPRAPESDAVEIPDGEARNLIARGFAREAEPDPVAEQEAPADGVAKDGIEAPADGTEQALAGDGAGDALPPIAAQVEPRAPKGRRK